VPATQEELAEIMASLPQSVSAGDKQRAVSAMVSWAWQGYANSAFGFDELKPLSRGGSDWLHLGLTVVDGLDTLRLAGLEEEYAAARDWVVSHLDYEEAHTPDVYVNVFETSIRVLGGLAAAHHLAPGGDEELLLKAAQLAPRLAGAFAATPTGIPLSDVCLASRRAKAPDWGHDSSVSEASTLSLEYVALAAAAADVTEGPLAPYRLPLAAAAAASLKSQRVVVSAAAKHDGLVVGKFISPASGTFSPPRLSTLGARVDSYYEYLLKGWLHTGKSDEGLLEAYQAAVHSVTTQLLARSEPLDAIYVGEATEGSLSSKMDHLVCFYPGLLALGHLHGVRARPAESEAEAEALQRLGLGRNATQLDVARSIAAACRAMYTANEAHMGPEIAYFDGDGGINIHPADAHSLLRPEYVESLFILWRVTGEQQWRDWGWDVARGIERHARVASGGYASIDSVTAAQLVQRDHMESFFLAETLKYLLLLFDDRPELYPLDQFVFNTEAHALPILKGGMNLRPVV